MYKEETFNACELIPSSIVLGTLALEGHVGGPVLVAQKADGSLEILEKVEPTKEP